MAPVDRPSVDATAPATTLLERGIATAPSQFEANFISAAHTAEDIAATVDAMTSVLAEVFA